MAWLSFVYTELNKNDWHALADTTHFIYYCEVANVSIKFSGHPYSTSVRLLCFVYREKSGGGIAINYNGSHLP